jgi:hypothetical protein
MNGELRDGGSERRLRPTSPGLRVTRRYRETRLGQFDRQDRRRVAVVATTDGRRVHVPIEPADWTDVSLLSLIRSLLGLDGLLGLITGSRRENGGTRRSERR